MSHVRDEERRPPRGLLAQTGTREGRPVLLCARQGLGQPLSRGEVNERDVESRRVGRREAVRAGGQGGEVSWEAAWTEQPWPGHGGPLGLATLPKHAEAWAGPVWRGGRGQLGKAAHSPPTVPSSPLPAVANPHMLSHSQANTHVPTDTPSHTHKHTCTHTLNVTDQCSQLHVCPHSCSAACIHGQHDPGVPRSWGGKNRPWHAGVPLAPCGCVSPGPADSPEAPGTVLEPPGALAEVDFYLQGPHSPHFRADRSSAAEDVSG